MKTRNKAISLLICISMLMQFLSMVAFASEESYEVVLEGMSAATGDFITYFDIQDRITDSDANFALMYNSDFYDTESGTRQKPAIEFKNIDTKEVFDETLESSPLKCVYEEDEYGDSQQTGKYTIDFYVPHHLTSGTYNITIKTYPLEKKEVLETVKPMIFVIENFKVKGVDAPATGGGGGGGGGLSTNRVIDIDLPLADVSELSWVGSSVNLSQGSSGERTDIVQVTGLTNSETGTVGVMFPSGFAFQDGDVLTYSIDIYPVLGNQLSPAIWLRNQAGSKTPFVTFNHESIPAKQWTTITRTVTYDEIKSASIDAGSTGDFCSEGEYALYLRPRSAVPAVLLDNFKVTVERMGELGDPDLFYYADFTINDGDIETNSEEIILTLEVDGYTKYKINGEEVEYIPEDKTVYYTLSNGCDTYDITIEFFDDEETASEAVTKQITYKKNHKLTYWVNEEVYEQYDVKCWDNIPEVPDPDVSDYTFKGWDYTGETMPCSDLDVYAILEANPEPEEPSIFTYTIENGEVTITGCDKTASGEIIVPAEIDGYPVKKIRNSAFSGNSNITSIILSDGIETIDNYGFNGCRNLNYVTIPASVTSIGDGAFNWLSYLYGITVDEGNPNYSSFDGDLFDKSKTKLIKYAVGKGYISYAIPDGVEVIEASAFSNTSMLNNVVIPASVISIGAGAFDNLSLQVVYYGGTREEWEEVEIGSNNTRLLNATMYYADDPQPEELFDYTIENEEVTITGICPEANGAIKIPAYIEELPVTQIAWAAFQECINIASVEIPDSVKSMGGSIFWDCVSLKSVTLPKGIETIDYGTFYNCRNLTEITIPDGVTKIAVCAFENCKRLETITIPDSVTEIEDGAFTDCYAITDVYYGGTEDEWNAIVIGTYGNDALLNATIHFAEEEPDEPEEPTDSEIVFTIEDTTTLLPVSGAKVIIVNADETKAQEITSNENGTAALAIPNGTYTVQVMASGYDIRTFTVEKTDENYEFSVYLNKNPLIKIETSAKVMTKQEMVDAGIDVEAADNKQVYKCTTVLKFVPVATGSGSVDITPIEINFDYIYDAQGTIINAQPVRQDGVVIYPVAKDIYLIVHSETTWLKEMFDVQLVVANTSSIEKIKDCEVNLDLPEGLSLATMVEGEQSLTVSVEEIKPKETKDIHWYVRGDKAGEYVIGGNITGVREGGGIIEDLKASFTMQDPVTVLAGDAMKLKIEAERFATAGQPYKMRYTLQNVSSRTLYDVVLNVLGGKFCKAYSVEELIHNGELVDLDALAGSFNNGVELKDEEFEPGEVLTGVFEITFGQGITTENIEYMVTEMYTFTGEGSTTTIPTEVVLVDSVGDHMYDDGEITVEPTCTTSGTMVYNCTTCSETMEVTVPALGHALGNWVTSQEPTCTAEGEKYRECRNCDYTETAVLGKVSHKYDLEVINEPTTTDEGVMKCTCSVCGEVTTVPISVCTVGDINDDEGIDTKDVISVRRFISGGYGVNVYLAAADANKDGIVDVKDVILVRRFVVGGYGVEL